MAVVMLLMCAASLGQNARPGGTIAANVNGQPVHAAEVEAEFRQAYGDRELDEVARQRLMRVALEQVIDRRLVLSALMKSGEAASDKDVDFATAQFERELKAQNLTLAQHCEKVGLSPEDVRHSLTWKLSWKRYCEKHLTPQNLEKYFDRNRRDFDGTQVRVAQILFKLKPDADEAAIAAVKERAAKIKDEIQSAKVAFAAAAHRDSQSPSRTTGGDIGWIERRQPMPEGFSKAAFALKKGEISEPLVTQFGVHLLTVLDEKPGTLTWRDTEGELRPAVIVYLFRWLADRERATASIAYVEK